MSRALASIGLALWANLSANAAETACPADLGTSTPAADLIACVGSLVQDVADLKGKPALIVSIPVGTIIASYLAPSQFAASIAEDESVPLGKRTWILADGRPSAGTAFARLTNDRPIPDLRGMFLRGSDGTRLPGDVQGFSTALPTIAFSGATSSEGAYELPPTAGTSGAGDKFDAGGTNYLVVGVGPTAPMPAHSHTFSVTGGGDPETRPANVAVYYYIKVN